MFCEAADKGTIAEDDFARYDTLLSPSGAGGPKRARDFFIPSLPHFSSYFGIRHSRLDMSSAPLHAPAFETELTIATRRLMQAEENAAQAGARVLQQWNVVQTIMAKPPTERQDRELGSAQAALEFAKAANGRAEKACAAAELDKAQARADAAASANAICDSRSPIAALCKRRHADDDDDDDDDEMGARENEEEVHEPVEKRSKSSSSSASSSSSSSSTSSSSSSSSVSSSAPALPDSNLYAIATARAKHKCDAIHPLRFD